MKYRSTDIVEPNGIRSARTDWWPVGIALSSMKRVPLRTRLQIGLTVPLSPAELPVDRPAIRFSFVTKFAIRPSDDTWPSFNYTGNAANPGDTYTRPNPRLFIHPQWTTWTSWIFDRSSWFSRFVNDIRA